ncbi:MAG: carbohydrate-binding domain-containing protein [Clostridia bacterium]|nr:carbohydrate-binding domain-containing protein [Clostridia bacterium]
MKLKNKVFNFYCKYAAFMLAVFLVFNATACSSKVPNVSNNNNTPMPAQTASSQVNVEGIAEKITAEFSERDKEGTWEDKDAVKIEFNDSKTILSDSMGIISSEHELTISKEGVYVLNGEFTGTINIAADKTEKVQLVLNGVSLKSNDGPAINIIQADKVFITLAPDTENTVTDSNVYSSLDEDGEPYAAVFSKDDLTINGSGSLTVNGNYMHGIVSKDDLTVYGSTINVTAKNTALRGRDEVAAKDAVISVQSKTNGIDSNNDTDEGRGNIILENCVVSVISDGDGIQASRALQITDSAVKITSGGGAADIIKTDNGGMEWHRNGMNFEVNNQYQYSEDNNSSSKGIKAGTLLRIDGGSFEIDSNDDALHSNGDVVLSPDTVNIASGDDGVHADTALYLLSGNIQIAKSYEGLEGSQITVSGGDIEVISSDDGMNAAGGADASGVGGMADFGYNPKDKFSVSDSSDAFIKILGGNIHINAEGDGIDSNGLIEVFDGVTLVEGTSGGGNGALDYQISACISGGTFIAVGSSDMALGFSEAENQCAAFINFKSVQQAGSAIALFDDADNFIMAFAPIKQYSSVVISAPQLISNSSYELKYGGTITSDAEKYITDSSHYLGGSTYATLEFTSTILNINGNGSGIFGGGGRQPGGRR